MANHKSAEKRIRANEKKRVRNRYQHKSTRTVIKNRHFLDSLAFLISAGQDVAITGTFSANRTVLHIASSGTNAVGALEQISRELSLFADDGKTPRLFDFALY